MTDLQILSKVKEKPFVTNCYMMEHELFNTEQSSNFDIQIGSDSFCFYKNTNYNFKQMYFYVNHNEILKNNPLEWKEYCFVTEVVTLDKFSDKNLQIKKWLNIQGNYHYRTFLRMYSINISNFDDIDFSNVENPKGSDFEEIKEQLEVNFDIYSERIPSVEELKLLRKSTYIIKHENQIAAILVSELKGKTEELRYWLVVPDYRDKGYGGLLMKFYLNCNKGTKRYTLWVDSINKNVINKYEFFGFVKDRIVNSIYINKNIMRDKIIEILVDTRPEFDFNVTSINFMESGYLDSFDIVTIVADLEEVFDVKINGALIVPESFCNVDSIVNLVQNSKNAS
jgi:acyl carrier protein